VREATIVFVAGQGGVVFDVPIAAGLTGAFTPQYVAMSVPLQLDWSNGVVRSI
jgi:hypothetical protein